MGLWVSYYNTGLVSQKDINKCSDIIAFTYRTGLFCHRNRQNYPDNSNLHKRHQNKGLKDKDIRHYCQ